MKFQPIPIDSYFLHFPDTLLDEARSLVEKGSVKLVKQDKRRGYWLFEVHEDQKVEVEVLIGKTKIRSFSCDCFAFHETKVCCHILAAIRIVLDSKERDQLKLRSSRTPRNLHTRDILQGISEASLRNFVTQYASQNPHFALMLKAKFAHNIEIENNLDKYFGLCKRFASTLGQGSLGSLKLKKLVPYVDDLLDLADDLLSIGNFRETHHLIYGVLRFLNLRYVMYGEDVLEPLLRRSHEKLQKLLLSDIAPQLRKQILGSFFEVIRQERYVVLDDLNLYAILVQFHLTVSDKIQVIERLRDYIAKTPQNDEAIFSLVQIYIQLNKSLELVDLISAQQENFQLVERSLKWIVEKQNTKSIIIKLTDKLYALAEGRRLKNLSFQYLINVTDKRRKRINLCVDYFLYDCSLESYLKIKSILGDDFTKAFDQIIPLLEDKRDFNSLTMLLGEEGQLIKLFEIVDREKQIDLLLPNLNYLYDNFYPQTEALLMELVRNFLNIHVGQHAFEFTHQIIRHLRRERFTKLVSAVLKMISNDFGERTLLMRSLHN